MTAIPDMREFRRPPAEPTEPQGEPVPAAETRLDSLRARLLDGDGLATLPEPEYLIDGILVRDSLAFLQGRAGCGKSLVALSWAGAVATGSPWFGRETAAGLVLYVAAEGARGLRPRLRAYEQDTGLHVGAGIRFLPEAVQLLDDTDHTALLLLVEELKPVLIVLDTQARMTVGAEENSARDMGLFVEAVERIRRVCGACVLVVHHEGRAGENLRGSSALEGAAQTVVRATKDGPHVRLDNPKQKDDDPFSPMLLRLVPVSESVVLRSHEGVGNEPPETDSMRHLLETMRDNFETTGASSGDLREVSGLSKPTYHRALNRLVRQGALRNDGTDRRPLYKLGGAP